MAVAVRIHMTDDSAYRALRRLELDGRRINRLVLGRLGEKLVSHVQENGLTGRPGLNVRTGNLRTGLHYNWIKDDAIFIGPHAVYGAIHEYGGEIHPLHAKALRWKGEDGQWRFAKSVTIPKRPWLLPWLRDYFDRGLAASLIERTLQAELSRLERSS